MVKSEKKTIFSLSWPLCMIEPSITNLFTNVISFIYSGMKYETIYNIIIPGEHMYITLHLMQAGNITTDETIQDLVKKLADGSLILYDLHKYRLYVPEQPLRIMQPRNMGKTKIEYLINLYFEKIKIPSTNLTVEKG